MPKTTKTIPRPSRRILLLTLALLAIEFLDEFCFSVREAAWPMIRTDLGLDYIQIGILLTVPNVLGNLIEPVLGLLSDVRDRRRLILGGGIVFTLALILIATSWNFWILLCAFIFIYPASGAFVSLSQATLMDLDPQQHEKSMARWTVAGSLGVVVGPLMLGGLLQIGQNWRWAFIGLSLLSFLMVLAIRPVSPITVENSPDTLQESLSTGLRNAWQALHRREVIRWLVLLEFSDLMLDVLLGFLALYLTDVTRLSEIQAATAVAVWSGVGLLGDIALVPLLERVKGLAYLRCSALIELLGFSAFLLWPGFVGKLILLGLLGFFNSGWYAILKARLYASMPGQSGTSLALNNLSSLIGSLLPLGLGLIAQRFGLAVAMPLLLVGPLALLIGLPAQTAD